MSKFWQILKAVGVVAVVVALGILVGWLFTRTSGQPRVVTPTETASGNPSVPPQVPVIPPVPQGKRPGPRINTNSRPTIVQAAPSNLVTNWEPALEKILEPDDVEIPIKAKQLLELLPRVPEEGQVEIAHHLVNLTDDKDFGPLGAYLLDPNTPEAVAEVFMDDLLNRPNSIKLPLLLEVARSSRDQTAAADAKEVLALFLDEDYGTDWATWQNKLQQWLQENPD